jgi:hypothetical protein
MHIMFISKKHLALIQAQHKSRETELLLQLQGSQETVRILTAVIERLRSRPTTVNFTVAVPDKATKRESLNPTPPKGATVPAPVKPQEVVKPLAVVKPQETLKPPVAVKPAVKPASGFAASTVAAAAPKPLSRTEEPDYDFDGPRPRNISKSEWKQLRRKAQLNGHG